MRWRKAGLVVTVGASLVIALLGVFALELANTQAKSKSEIDTQVRERGQLAAALINSLFQTTTNSVSQYSQEYGAETVPDSAMDSAATGNLYAALVGSGSRILAASSGFTPEARANLRKSAALGLVDSGHAYGLGNLVSYGKTGVYNLAVPFPTDFGTRILLTGLDPNPQGVLVAFLARELTAVPGVKGSYNSLVDGNDVLIASSDPAAVVGRPVPPRGVHALNRLSGNSGGMHFVAVPLLNATWLMVLSSPNAPLYASVTGLRQVLPWLIFVAFALVAALALILGWRALGSADQLQVLNAHLARSNEELDQFASITSHDLQEPLRKVRAFTEQLTVMEAENLSEKGRDYLVRTNAAAARMQRLIEDLLKFSRVSTQARPFEPVDLAEVAREVLSDLDLQVVTSGAIVHVGDLPTISADPLQMRQLIQNLVSNAVKFRRDDVVPKIFVESTVENDHVRLIVRDNGIGFDPRYNLRIFRVFERLHGQGDYPGTGIGLALCRKIADRHGGRITADGEPGVGSTFTVTLPLRTHEHRVVLGRAHRSGVGADLPNARVDA